MNYCDACGRELGGTWYEGTNDAGEPEILCPSCAGDPPEEGSLEALERAQDAALGQAEAEEEVT